MLANEIDDAWNTSGVAVNRDQRFWSKDLLSIRTRDAKSLLYVSLGFVQRQGMGFSAQRYPLPEPRILSLT